MVDDIFKKIDSNNSGKVDFTGIFFFLFLIILLFLKINYLFNKN